MNVYRSVCRERLPASLSDRVDMLLYLDVEPTECHRRMNHLRKREEESVGFSANHSSVHSLWTRPDPMIVG